MRGSDILAKKKEVKECSNCEYHESDDCGDCDKKDLWTPKDGGKAGETTITMSAKGPGGVEIGKPVTFNADKLEKVAKQLDLEGKEVEYPIKVTDEKYTVLEFKFGFWHLKVREDRLEESFGDGELEALVQKRLKADADAYPLPLGEFDRWVDRFLERLEEYCEGAF